MNLKKESWGTVAYLTFLLNVRGSSPANSDQIFRGPAACMLST
jgi:hypothetical protein